MGPADNSAAFLFPSRNRSANTTHCSDGEVEPVWYMTAAVQAAIVVAPVGVVAVVAVVAPVAEAAAHWPVQRADSCFFDRHYFQKAC